MLFVLSTYTCVRLARLLLRIHAPASAGWVQDSAKTRMQSQPPSTAGKPLKYTSTLQTLSHVVKAEGFASLWKGFTPYFARSGTHTVRFGGREGRCSFLVGCGSSS